MRERQWGSLQKCTCVCVHIKITKRNGVYFLTLLCQTLFIQKKKKHLLICIPSGHTVPDFIY